MLHCRCNRMIYNDKLSPQEDFLIKLGSVFIHNKNIQDCALRVLIKSKLNRDIVNDFL